MEREPPVLTTTPDTASPTAGVSRPFPLLRYYVLTSLTVISTVTIIVAILFVRRAEFEFTPLSTDRTLRQASQVALVFYDDVWAPGQRDGVALNLRDVSEPAVLSDFYNRNVGGLGVVAFTVLSLDGTVLWSNSPYDNDHPPDMGSFATVVRQGTPASDLKRDEVTMDAAGGNQRLDLVRTYYPLRDPPPPRPRRSP